MGIVYSTQFAAQEVPADTNQLLYTVPSGMVMVLRELDLSAVGGTGATRCVPEVVPVSTGVIAHLADLSLEPLTSYQWTGNAVLNPGDQLQLHVFDGVSIWVIASGYLLQEL